MRYAIGIVVGPGDQPLVVDRRCPGSLVLAGSGAWRIEHLQRTAAGAQKTMKHIVAIDRLADDRGPGVDGYGKGALIALRAGVLRIESGDRAIRRA